MINEEFWSTFRPSLMMMGTYGVHDVIERAIHESIPVKTVFIVNLYMNIVYKEMTADNGNTLIGTISSNVKIRMIGVLLYRGPDFLYDHMMNLE